MRRASKPGAETIVIVCGSQMGKTESLLCILGHRLDDGPYVPALWVAPTERMVKTIAGDRVNKLLRTTPDLWAKTAKGRQMKLAEKWVGGLRLGFAHAGSAAELAMNAVGLLLVDERDRMIADVAGEGDPFVLAQARTKNFPRAVTVVCSTPTVEGASPIWSLFLEGTQEKWAFLCPACGEHFIPTLELLKWPDKATAAIARRKAFVVCPECGAELRDKDKGRMNREGRYIPHILVDGQQERAEEIPDNPIHSFWASGLASPWQTFGQIAEKLVSAYESHQNERIQSVVNTYGGEVWRVSGDAPDWEVVWRRRGGYSIGYIPPGVRFVTLGVDVQRDRLFWAARGWGVNAESWGLGEGALFGDTAYDSVWVALGGLIKQPFGDKLVARAFIDSGYRPSSVWQRPDNVIYQFCRRHPGLAFPTKGHDRQDTPLKTRMIDVTSGGHTIKGGVRLWHLDTDSLKTSLYGKIRAPSDEPGAWHCHDAITQDYAKQVVAEEVLVKASGKRTWMVKGPNHYLDCEVLNLAAAMSLNVYSLAPIAKAAPTPQKPAPRGSFERHRL